MNPTPALHLKAFQAPKEGQPPETCQDSWMALGHNQPRGGPIRLAISDGATTTAFSALWARLLVEAATRGIAPWTKASYRASKLPMLRRWWRDGALAGLPDPLPWYTEASLDRGAFATLLRVKIHRGAWEAEAWGDTCLFHMRSGKLLQMLPNLTPDDFSLAPCMLASVDGHDEALTSGLVRGRGDLQCGDLLILASDALARWFRAAPDPDVALMEAASLKDEEAFGIWVAELRSSRGLQDDDTTLLVGRLP